MWRRQYISLLMNGVVKKIIVFPALKVAHGIVHRYRFSSLLHIYVSHLFFCAFFHGSVTLYKFLPYKYLITVLRSISLARVRLISYDELLEILNNKAYNNKDSCTCSHVSKIEHLMGLADIGKASVWISERQCGKRQSF